MEAKLNHACEEKRPWLPRCTIRCPWLPGCTMRCLLVHRSHDCHAPVTSIFRPRTPPSAIRAMLPIQNKSGWDFSPTFSCVLGMDGWWYQTCRMKPKSIFFCPRMQRHVPHIAGPPRPAQARHWVPSWPSCPRLPPATTKSCHVFNNKTRVDVLCFRPAAKIDAEAHNPVQQLAHLSQKKGIWIFHSQHYKDWWKTTPIPLLYKVQR